MLITSVEIPTRFFRVPAAVKTRFFDAGNRSMALLAGRGQVRWRKNTSGPRNDLQESGMNEEETSELMRRWREACDKVRAQSEHWGTYCSRYMRPLALEEDEL